MATKKENVRDFRAWLNVGLTGFAIWVLQSFWASYREDGKENRQNWKEQQQSNAEFREYMRTNNAKLEDQSKNDSVFRQKINGDVEELKDGLSELGETMLFKKWIGENSKNLDKSTAKR